MDTVLRRSPIPPSTAAVTTAGTGRRRRFVLALAGPVLAGAISALVMPRGPVDTGQALLAMALGIAAGLAAGYLAQSRSALASAPLVALAVVELGRLGHAGITVEAPRIDSTWGVLALLAGRGVQGLLTGVPMIVAAAFGAAVARRRAGVVPTPGRRATAGRVARRCLTWTSAAGIAALAAAVAVPAWTPPILDAGGHRLAGSVAELVTVPVRDGELTVSLRGRNMDNPVLLYLEGGPGGSSIGSSRVVFSELERDFVVAVVDQRGAGMSYGAIEPRSALTLGTAIEETTTVTDYLRTRFGESKIYLMGESWGTILGVLTVQRHPERFAAYIGSGQMVDPRETDNRLYDDVLAYAARTGDRALADRMRSFGRPPYRDTLGYAFVMGYYEKIEPYTDPTAYRALARRPGNDVGMMGLKAPEYSLMGRVGVVRGLLDTFALMYPQLQGIDFRRDVTRLEIPVYVLVGDHELEARSALVPQWLDRLSAPRIVLERYHDSAHAPHATEFERFHRFMVDTVLPQTHSGH
jgi:pimeloyl-ACP methyl ester carboxylesterase